MRLRDIFEGRDALLFHGTGLNGAIEILKQNRIAPKTAGIRLPGYKDEDDNFAVGASLTRDPRMATEFGSVVFALDQRRLSHRVRLVPYDYWGQSAEVTRGLFRRRNSKGSNRVGTLTAEAEEFAVGGVPNLSDVLVAIWIAPSRREDLERSPPGFGGAILLRHPLLQPNWPPSARIGQSHS